MPYTDEQRKLAGLALHHPEKVHKKNRSILSMSANELRHMATYGSKSKKGKKKHG